MWRDVLFIALLLFIAYAFAAWWLMKVKRAQRELRELDKEKQLEDRYIEGDIDLSELESALNRYEHIKERN